MSYCFCLSYLDGEVGGYCFCCVFGSGLFYVGVFSGVFLLSGLFSGVFCGEKFW